MRKPAFCICENKGADQLRGNREADQRLCFRYIDSTIPLLSFVTVLVVIVKNKSFRKAKHLNVIDSFISVFKLPLIGQ